MAMASMARRALLPSSLWLFFLLISCQEKKEIIRIPAIFVSSANPMLRQENGYLLYRSERFSGRKYDLYPNGDTAALTPYYLGKEEGLAMKWYPGGGKMENRFYHGGGKEGTHLGWWENGRHKFEYHFLNDEHEGEAREWFSNGSAFRCFHYHRGQEEGQQEMWWEDGRIRANYIVKDGQQYGLIGRKLCKNPANEGK
jgi:antitoxin component YwqK of YwqJK toxin-antitoxin module